MTFLPLHETINRWIDEAYIPQQPHAMLNQFADGLL